MLLLFSCGSENYLCNCELKKKNISELPSTIANVQDICDAIYSCKYSFLLLKQQTTILLWCWLLDSFGIINCCFSICSEKPKTDSSYCWICVINLCKHFLCLCMEVSTCLTYYILSSSETSILGKKQMQCWKWDEHGVGMEGVVSLTYCSLPLLTSPLGNALLSKWPSVVSLLYYLWHLFISFVY